MSQEYAYLALIFTLVVVPRVLQRFRIPGALTSFALGMAAMLFFDESGSHGTLALLAMLGISSLFLFAGLEIELADLRRSAWALVTHVGVRLLTVAGTAFLAMRFLGFEWRPASLLALALLTPSTGFILESLPGLGLDESERYWVRVKAIAGELFALVVLFFVLQSESIPTLVGSTLALAALGAAIPALFLVLARYVIPYASGSEFSLLVMVGVVAAVATNQIGVYYLVGAFLVGFVAKLLNGRIPSLAGEENLHAIKMFASFFVPIYFFHKGTSVPAGALSFEALLIGASITLVVLPARIGVVWVQRRFIQEESAMGSLRVAAALTPTLIFALVIAGILRERFGIPDTLYGGLLIYAAISTALPSLVLARTIDFAVPVSHDGSAPAGQAPPAKAAGGDDAAQAPQ